MLSCEHDSVVFAILMEVMPPYRSHRSIFNDISNFIVLLLGVLQ